MDFSRNMAVSYGKLMKNLNSNQTEPIILSQSVFKGYLHYKTILSQNVPSEAQVKNFFYFVEKL